LRNSKSAGSIFQSQLLALYVPGLLNLYQSVGPQLILFQPRLLVTNLLDREYIFLYEAEITTELLNALRNPKDATSPVQCTIRRKRIPYKPYDSFADRLFADLVTPDSSNALDNDVDRAIECKKKRQHEQGDRGSYKIRRVSS
jgi:hypothetical protein